MIITLDIETLPTSDPAVVEEIANSVKPPKTLKKPESIAAWERDDKPAAVDEAIAKTSFSGLYGSICVISMAADNGDPVAFHGNDERAILASAFAWIDAQSSMSIRGRLTHKPVTFCGHNIYAFDLPFIKHRAIIHGVRPPQSLRTAFAAKPWGSEVADTMIMWSSDREQRASMDKLCKAFGIQGKGDFDGSMVAGTWSTDPLKVVEYCNDDVRRTRAIYLRLMIVANNGGFSDEEIAAIKAHEMAEAQQ